jgi:hypothetical protein
LELASELALEPESELALVQELEQGLAYCKDTCSHIYCRIFGDTALPRRLEGIASPTKTAMGLVPYTCRLAATALTLAGGAHAGL